MPSGFNGTQQIVDIPASTAAFIAILATGPCRKIRVWESPLTAGGNTNTLIGLLEYQIPNDGTAAGFTTIFEAIGANDITTEGQITVAEINLGDDPGAIGSHGSMLGNGPNTLGQGLPATPATTLLKIRSGGGATSVVVRQDY
jgi:hypothetical protein